MDNSTSNKQTQGRKTPKGLQIESVHELLDNYEAVLLDKSGVLVGNSGALPGAQLFLDELKKAGKPYCVVSNDASKSIPSTALQLASLGLIIGEEQIINSSALVSDYLSEHGLTPDRVLVVGPEESQTLLGQNADALEIIKRQKPLDAVVICDSNGYPFIETINAVISLCFQLIDKNHPFHLVLANPDFIYPTSMGGFGITAGSAALLIEKSLSVRYHNREVPQFVRLGKPFEPIFHKAFERLGTRNVLMVGDQIGTDIYGANRVGIDSVLIPSGVSEISGLVLEEQFRPTYIASGLM